MVISWNGVGRLKVIIMAGGRGERLWPMSRTTRPKQFLTLFQNKSLFQLTLERAQRICSMASVHVVCPDEQMHFVRDQAPELPEQNSIVEPVGRDTGPCLVLSHLLLDAPEDEVCLVLPADHWIGDAEGWSYSVQAAAASAEREKRLITFGIRPTRPETGYGYIKWSGAIEPGVHRVDAFVEKPDQLKALEFLQSGQYLWNSGMFIWTKGTFLREAERYMSESLRVLKTGLEQESIRETYGTLKPVSIDHALLEKSERVSVLPCSFPWDDLGNWAAMSRAAGTDEQGNVVSGDVFLHEVQNSTIMASTRGRKVVAFGLEDGLVVDTDDVVLVTNRFKAPEIKRLISALRDTGHRRLVDEVAAALMQAEPDEMSNPAPVSEPERVVAKPWGREVWWALTDRYVGKVIEVEPGQALSLQYHERKHETLWVVSGRGHFVLGNKEFEVGPGYAVTLVPLTIHRIRAITKLVVVEVSTPEVSDVVRLSDQYGRASPSES